MDASCIRVLSIDDHPLVREGIGTIIKSQADMLLLGTASNGKEGITAFRALSPDVTLMDLRLPDLSGLDVMIAIRSEFPACRKDKSWRPGTNWDQASVLHIDVDRNVVTVMRESDGTTFSYNERRTGASATVYEPGYREFADSDRVQFTRALRQDKIANRTLGTIEAIDTAGNVSLRLDDGRRWHGNLERMPHLTYGYVMTSYAAQGTTAERVLVHLDTDGPGVGRMVNQQLIYVAASRGREEMQVFVNSREDLAEALVRREEKATALAPQEIGRYREISI